MSSQLIKLDLTSDLKIVVIFNPEKSDESDRYRIRGGVTHPDAWTKLKADFALDNSQAALCMGGFLRLEANGEISVSPESDSFRGFATDKIVTALSHFYPERIFRAAS